MEKVKIRKKIKRFEGRRDEHIAAGRPISAEMEDNVAKALTGKLEEIIGGSPK